MKKIIIVLLAEFMFSCNSTRIISSWKNPDSQDSHFKKVLVIGLSQPDNNLRQKMEAHLVEDLQNNGTSAVSAYQLYGPKAFENLDEKAILDKIQSSGVDALLTIVLLDKTKERNYIHPRLTYTPYAVYYNRFWGYYSTLYARVYTPGYYISNTEYFWESNLYNAESRQLIYSVQTKSFQAENAESVAHEYGKAIISQIIAQGILAR